MGVRDRFFAWHLVKTIYSGPMFRIGELFELADSAVARVGLAVIGILAVLALGAEVSGLLDISELVTSFPLLAFGGGVLGSMWVGATTAAWFYRESVESGHPARSSESTRAPDTPDLLPKAASLEPRPSFRDRVSTGRLVADDSHFRGNF
jgi:hypothetical protein